MEATEATIDMFDIAGLEKQGFCPVDPKTKLYHALFGKGTTKVLLLMGICTSGLAWKNQIEYFLGFPQFQVCIVDNRGSGKTECPFNRLTTSQMAQDVVVLLKHLGWDKYKVHVVGNSLGGMIAQEFVLAVPQNVATLTLINTHAGGWKSYIPPFYALFSISRHIVAKDEKERAQILMQTVFSKEHLKKPGRKEHLSIIKEEFPTILDFYVNTFVSQFSQVFSLENALLNFMQQMTAVLTHRVSWRRLSSLKNRFPCLVICGTADKIVHPSHSRRLAAALGAELMECQGAGHAVTEECLDQVNESLRIHFCKTLN
jgi:pimeloyl-ACP methyl ester carboxylesterase